MLPPRFRTLSNRLADVFASIPLLAWVVAVFAVAPLSGQQKWTPEDGRAFAWFGFSVALDGNWQAAGSPFEDSFGPRSGAVHVLNSVTGTEHRLDPLDAASGQRFGSSLDLSGQTLVVGAPGGGPSGSEVGAAYVFEFDGLTWNQVARLDGMPGHAGDGFGTSVAIHGDRILVGAPWNNQNGAQAGAAFAFQNISGTWALLEELRAPATGPGDAFGYALDMDSRWACIGAYSANTAVFNEGAAYAYDWTGVEYTLHTTLLETPALPNSNFGRAVAVHEDRIAVGATHDHSSLSESGQVSIFGWDGSAFASEGVVLPNAAAPGNAFGFSVHLGEGQLLVGAPGAVAPGGLAGGAYLFEVFADEWLQSRDFTFTGSNPQDFIGVSVRLDGNQGLVGAMRDQDQGWMAGAAYALDDVDLETPEVVSFCGCDGGTPCAGPGSPHGCENSVGSGAVMGIEGSASIAADDMVLSMSGMTSGQFGFFWMGDGATHVVLFDGYRCVHSGSQGLYRTSLAVSDASGVMRTGPGIVAGAASIPVTLTAGSQWSFQGIYRDNGGPCGTGVNLSDAIWVTFRP